MKQRQSYFFVFILACFLTFGCTPLTPKPPTGPYPDQVQVPAETDSDITPDLLGGPESQKRVVDTKQIREISSRFPGILFFSGPSNVKQAALTFDDGPDRNFTVQILNILKSNGVKATFFLVGRRAQSNPDIVKQIALEGHVIGNHTWDHHDLTKLSPDQLRAEVQQADQTLFSILGYHPAIFRPPYGAATPNDIRLIASLGYKVIDWSVDTRDWAGTPPNKIMEYFSSEFRAGGIILEHSAGGKRENLGNTVTALPEIISTLKNQGYSFVTIPELLNIPAKFPS